MKPFNGFATGLYNDATDPNNPAISSLDRIFQIGNGTGPQSRSNAVTVLRNGKVGIGLTDPDYILDIKGGARVRHSGSTSGIWFEDIDPSNNQPFTSSFVGMAGYQLVGFYNNGKWGVYTDGNHTTWINTNLKVKGTLDVDNIDMSSDRNLKRDISTVTNSLEKLNAVTGYNFFWKDSNRQQILQAGVLAQEVERVFPELVKTDENGKKSVNYLGLVPHLIESVKNLKNANEAAMAMIRELQNDQRVRKERKTK